MPLPSQVERKSAHRSSVFRGQNQRRSSRLVFLLALVIMAGIWGLMGPGEQEPALASETALDPEVAGEEALELPDAQAQGTAASTGSWLDNVRLPGEDSLEVPGEASGRASGERSLSSAPLDPAPASPSGSPRQLEASSLSEPGRPMPGRVADGLALLAEGDLVAGRRLLSMALLEGGLTSAEASRVRAELSPLGERWILGQEIFPGDPFCSTYKIAKGDLLSRLPKSQGLGIDWRLLQRVNGIQDPGRIRLGQELKLVRGPFHAVVTKSEYRLDLYLGDPEERIFVTAFDVGHGEFNSTPEGLYQVRQNSKLINPAWTNPRTKERVAADDPENPIGEHWIGLEGVSEAVIDVEQIGIHGTTDLPSIGQMRSMGCVRMYAEDVALIYEVLVRPGSRIEIRP